MAVGEAGSEGLGLLVFDKLHLRTCLFVHLNIVGSLGTQFLNTELLGTLNIYHRLLRTANLKVLTVLFVNHFPFQAA